MTDIQTDERSAQETERRMQFGLRRALQMPAKPNEPAKAKQVQPQSK
jgi:hypothetical protein